jgi:hypothetical protein
MGEAHLRRGLRGLAPGQQTLGQTQVPFHPSPEGHGPARIIKGLVPIPKKHVAVAFLAVAAQTGGHAVVRNALTASAEGPDMVD